MVLQVTKVILTSDLRGNISQKKQNLNIKQKENITLYQITGFYLNSPLLYYFKLTYLPSVDVTLTLNTIHIQSLSVA